MGEKDLWKRNVLSRETKRAIEGDSGDDGGGLIRLWRVMNQEEKDGDMVDEMSQEVDSRGEVMRIEMSDLWFSRLSEMEVEQGSQVSECIE